MQSMSFFTAMDAIKYCLDNQDKMFIMMAFNPETGVSSTGKKINRKMCEDEIKKAVSVVYSEMDMMKQFDLYKNHVTKPSELDIKYLIETIIAPKLE